MSLTMAEGGNWIEPLNSDGFVGRQDALEWLKEKYTTTQGKRGLQHHQYRIYGIYGKKGVGKSCLMQKFLQQIQQDDSRNQKVHVVSFNFDKYRNFESFLNSLCSFYGVENHKWKKDLNCRDDEEEEDDFMDCMTQIKKRMNDEPNNTFILFLDNMEHACGKANSSGVAPDSSKTFLRDKIYREIIHNLLPECYNFLVFITSSQTTRFAEFQQFVCSKDLKEMNDDEAICLLRSQVLEVHANGESLSAIVELCDGLPPTIIKAGAMLREGDYKLEEVVELLKEFESKRNIHNDELCAKDDRYDEQLRKCIDRLSNESKKNLRYLAKMISEKEGGISITKAASELNFDRNTALFKLRFLLPLRFRGMVEVVNEKISMNPFFQQFVIEYIKGEKNARVGLERASEHSSRHGQEKASRYSPPRGAQIGPNITSSEDDDDDYDAGSPSANHLIVPSANSPDKSCRLLEEVHDDDVYPHKGEGHRTVPSDIHQDRTSPLLGNESEFEKPEPNVAKMEGQYIGNREDKLQYDLTLTNQDSVGTVNRLTENNDLSSHKVSNRESPMNIPNTEHNLTSEFCTAEGKGDEGCNLDKTRLTGNNNVKMVKSHEKCGEEHFSEKSDFRKKRSDTLEENTVTTCKNQTHKSIDWCMSIENNSFQPLKGYTSSSERIPEKKLNRSIDEIDDSRKEKTTELPIGKENSSDHILSATSEVLQQSASDDSDVTEDVDHSETYEKQICDIDSRSGDVTALPPCYQLDEKDVLSSQYNGMPYFGTTDSHNTNSEDPSTEQSLNCSFSSVDLFASGRLNKSDFCGDGEDQRPDVQSFHKYSVQSMTEGATGSERQTLMKPPRTVNESLNDTALNTRQPTGQEGDTYRHTHQMYSSQTARVQGLSSEDEEVATPSCDEHVTNPSIQNAMAIGIEENLAGPVNEQKENRILAGLSKFFTNTIEVFKGIEG
ncbi:uncharacterized protein LOC132565169 [Ylistrum balloti]|uniref:uncharacterized protein LOC132565169 n=1 Tax=Ylistrum balloti TaxID=509963 RepID=UPI0029058815|nr:uncharacterized protein LOC132565169 [Ylistrum balloti]XP_060085774.1 uncharacterized protein LOC132565169 [Ylistrum balloti]